MIGELLAHARTAMRERRLTDARDALKAAMDLPGGDATAVEEAADRFRRLRYGEAKRRRRAMRTAATVTIVVAVVVGALAAAMVPPSLRGSRKLIVAITVSVTLLVVGASLRRVFPVLRSKSPSRLRLVREK
jgi:hypothetical protein